MLYVVKDIIVLGTVNQFNNLGIEEMGRYVTISASFSKNFQIL
jgi:hypothetical protein